MFNNHIHTENIKDNNIVYVSNASVKQSEKNAEYFAKQAEKLSLDCLNYVKTIQRVMADCEYLQKNLEISFENSIKKIEEQLAIDLKQEIAYIKEVI